ncbi:hypothetical protein MSG28_015809 [Choristoneura fumiferana]|uniref:Uncharacterized protein n=1 Tax=Choristoneura fumiferana TaxID=7141 RepID=A0ACC0KBK3_CHOFU|nr:hypothetical protein MSG28_015809 [Choristoneura fumiferana]
MFHLVSLLVAAALVSLQCGSEAHSQMDTNQLDNELKVNGEDSEDLLNLPLFTLPSKPIITSYYIQLFQDIGTNAVLPSGDLFITGIRWSDMGEYTCIAKNLYGKTINDAPHQGSYPPMQK